jgi:hypothetical protein
MDEDSDPRIQIGGGIGARYNDVPVMTTTGGRNGGIEVELRPNRYIVP